METSRPLQPQSQPTKMGGRGKKIATGQCADAPKEQNVTESTQSQRGPMKRLKRTRGVEHEKLSRSTFETHTHEDEDIPVHHDSDDDYYMERVVSSEELEEVPSVVGVSPSNQASIPRIDWHAGLTQNEGARPWRIDRGMPGGPHDPSVIPSYGGHVASYFWDGLQDRGVMICANREADCTTLKKWRNRMPLEVSKLVSGNNCDRDLSHLVEYMLPHIDWPLVCAFVERWQPDTNSFHLPFGEVTITLHDVFYILRLPIEGALVEGVSLLEGESLIRMLCELLGLTEDQLRHVHTYRNGGVLTKSIFENCGRDAGRPAHVEASAFLLAHLGSTLFVDKSKNRVVGGLIPYAMQLNKFYTYSWGSATLANLYRQLGIGSRAGCKQMGGCLSLLQAWIYSYFHMFRPSQYRIGIHDGEPTLKAWPHTRDPHSDERLVTFRTILDKLTPSSVTWTPFGQQPHVDVPRTLFVGYLRFMDVLEPYMPDRVVRQFGFVQQIPRPPFIPDEAHRPASAKQYNVKYSRAACASTWNYNTSNLRIDGLERAVLPYQAASDYAAWFESISHPHFVPPSAEISNDVDLCVDINKHFQNLFVAAMPLYGQELDTIDPGVLSSSFHDIQTALADYMAVSGYHFHPPSRR